MRERVHRLVSAVAGAVFIYSQNWGAVKMYLALIIILNKLVLEEYNCPCSVIKYTCITGAFLKMTTVWFSSISLLNTKPLRWVFDGYVDGFLRRKIIIIVVIKNICSLLLSLFAAKLLALNSLNFSWIQTSVTLSNCATSSSSGSGKCSSSGPIK